MLHNNAALSSFEDFSHLQSLHALEVVGTPISNFSGLEFVESLEVLEISENPDLVDFNGLDRLTQVTSRLFIENNPSLTDLGGLEAIRRIDGFMEVRGNIVLENFCGLESLFREGAVSSFTAADNAYNPTAEDIVSGNCKP